MLLRNSPPGARAIKTRFVTAPARARSRNLRAAVAIGLAGEAATRLNGARQLLPQPTTCNRHSAHHCRLQPLSHGRRQLHPPPHGLGPRGHKAHKSQTKDHEEGTPQGRREAPRRQSETAAQDQAGRRGREARAPAKKIMGGIRSNVHPSKPRIYDGHKNTCATAASVRALLKHDSLNLTPPRNVRCDISI